MPSATYSAALLAVGADIWTYPTWQERTKYIVPPFSSDATPSLTSFDTNELSAVRAFAKRIHDSTTNATALSAIAKARHNDTEGLRVWESWVDSNFTKWKIIQDLGVMLMQEGRHPRQLIATKGFVSAHTLCDFGALMPTFHIQGSRVPTMESVGVMELAPLFAGSFFGDDAFHDPDVPRPIVKEELRQLLSNMLAHKWHNMRTRVASQFERLRDGKAEANDRFDGAYAICARSRGNLIADDIVP